MWLFNKNNPDIFSPYYVYLIWTLHVLWSHRLLVHCFQPCILVNPLLDLLSINLHSKASTFCLQLFSGLKEDLSAMENVGIHN